MKAILSNIAMPLGHTEEELFAKCRQKLRCGKEQTFQVVKKSVDARDKKNIKLFILFPVTWNGFQDMQNLIKRLN